MKSEKQKTAIANEERQKEIEWQKEQEKSKKKKGKTAESLAEKAQVTGMSDAAKNTATKLSK